jgi:hypothetical protein
MIDVRTETLISRGVRGIRLGAVRSESRFLTFPEALQRFSDSAMGRERTVPPQHTDGLAISSPKAPAAADIFLRVRSRGPPARSRQVCRLELKTNE